MRFAAIVRSLPALFGTAFLLGCSSSQTTPPASDAGATADGPVLTCTGRADTFAANFTEKGNAFSFVLLSSDPAPPIRGTNTWILKIVDKSSQMVNDAKLILDVSMPEHNHGATVKAVATSNSDGTYTITPLYFHMAGVWRIAITAETPSIKDTAAFNFCIEG